MSSLLSSSSGKVDPARPVGWLGWSWALWLGLVIVSGADAQIDATWTGGGGNSSYSNTLNWDIGAVPVNNGDTFNVLISGGSTVSLDAGVPLGGGKLGFFNFSQPGDRYTNLNESAPLADGYYQLLVRSGGRFMEWVKPQRVPGIASIVGIYGPYRNAPPESIEITFSKPIQSGTFWTADFSLWRDGGANLIDHPSVERVEVPVELVDGPDDVIDVVFSEPLSVQPRIDDDNAIWPDNAIQKQPIKHPGSAPPRHVFR